jgi:hypothetical protein
MPVLANRNWSILRDVPASGAFTADADWISTNDVAAALAALFWEMPEVSLRSRLLLSAVFLDISGNALVSGPTAILDAERIQVIDDGVNEPVLVKTHKWQVIGDGTVLEADVPRSAGAFRLTAVANEPAGTDRVRLIGLLV